ncbi:hypothetical protein ccbrp13_34720 [Ktedonobacteria bacterium brp13]|nr:hypothetical protein ccbrp13_34720 [Ktedonobacteria bacterium brp13]
MNKEQKLLQRRDFLKVASSAGVAGTLMGVNIFSSHPNVFAHSETSADSIARGSLAVFAIDAKSSLWSVAENHSHPQVENYSHPQVASWRFVPSYPVAAPQQIVTGNFVNGRLGLFAISANNHLWYGTESMVMPGVLRRWQHGGNVASDYITRIAAGNFSDGRLGVFAIGTGGHLWYITEKAGWPETLGTWQRGGKVASDYSTQIAVGNFANGQLALFAIDAGNHLWYITENASQPGTLGTWQRGGNVKNDYSTQIAVGNFANGQLGLFAIDAGNRLWYITENAGMPGSLGDWQRGGNVKNDCSTQIAVGRFANSHLGLFVIDARNHLWYITENASQPGTLGTWQHGGNVASDYSTRIAVGNFANGQLGLFAIGFGGHLWYIIEDVVHPGTLRMWQRGGNVANDYSTQIVVGNYTKVEYRRQVL